MGSVLVAVASYRALLAVISYDPTPPERGSGWVFQVTGIQYLRIRGVRFGAHLHVAGTDHAPGYLDSIHGKFLC